LAAVIALGACRTGPSDPPPAAVEPVLVEVTAEVGLPADGPGWDDGT
jgi:hypothetical protein